MIENDNNNNSNNNNNNDSYDITYVYDNNEYCMSDAPSHLGMYRSESGVDICTLCMIEDARNNHALKYGDDVDSIKVNDDAIHCTKVDDAFNGCRNIFIKQGTYNNNNNIDNNHYNKRSDCNNTTNGDHTYGNYIGNDTANNANPRVPIHDMIMSVLFEAPFIYCNMQCRVNKKRARGGVIGIDIKIINICIVLLLLQGTVYWFGKVYDSTKILNQTRNFSNNNQCNTNNKTIDLLMSYTDMNIKIGLIGLYCVNPSLSLGNVRLPNVHTTTTVEMLALSLLELFGKYLKRIHVMKSSIMTVLDLSVDARKLGMGNVEYRKRTWY